MSGRPLNIAHRGASAYAPENTIAAFDLALALGADSLEIDVHMTVDEELVVVHDDVLGRTTNGHGHLGHICETKWREVSELDAGSWFNHSHPTCARREYEGERIPRLEDLFTRYGREVHYFIELKHPPQVTDMEARLLDLMGRYGLFRQSDGRSSVFIESFSQKSLRKIHDMDERVSVVQLFGAYATSKAIRAYLSALPCYSVAVGPCAVSVDPALAAQAERLHLDIYPWTVNEPAQMIEMLDLGAAGIVSDLPDVLDEAIRASGGPGRSRTIEAQPA
jgi:glycerophosphoryl diester phosphodiesterase